NIDSEYDGQIITGDATGRDAALSKIGTKTLTLAGTSTYLGDTYINNGTLLLRSTAKLSSTKNIFLNSSGNYDVSAAGYTTPSNQILQGDGGTVYGLVTAGASTTGISPGTSTTPVATLHF